jgi:SpoVK/Ycf46/Vps4 family AAA+-type ATPase
MLRLGKREIDFLTWYRDPAEASHAELLAARWAVQLFRVTGDAVNSALPRLGMPLEPLFTVAGRLLVWRRPLLDAINKALDGTPFPEGKPLSVARMSDMPLQGLAEGDSDFINRGLRSVLKQARWRERLVRDTLAWIDRARPAPLPSFRSAEGLAEGLGLPAFDCELLKTVLLRYEWPAMTDYLAQIQIAGTRDAAELIARVLDIAPTTAQAAIGRETPLFRYGVLDAGEPITDLADVLRLAPHFAEALTQRHEDATAFFACLLKAAPPTVLTRDDCEHLAAELDAAERLLTHSRSERGINILIHGRPGTGKTQFARYLAGQVGATLYEIACEDRDGESLDAIARLRMLRFADRVIGARENVALVFDEAEDAFPAGGPPMIFRRGRTGLGGYSKAWMNSTLESNRIPVIWISNEIREMDPAYLRRFTLHIEFREPSRSVRERIATRYLAPVGIPIATIACVAEEEDLSPAQLETAARFVRASGAAGTEAAERLFTQQFRAARKAMGLGSILKRPRQPLRYDPAFVNLAGDLGVEQLVHALGRRGTGSLCLWGPPGTGKTELAHHLARALDREIIVKTGGDLLHPFVGVTEMLIREMFERAAAQVEQCVLFLDEADTFLRDRSRVHANWEASHTNEFLRQMENFPGLFICATNLFTELDPAVLRRFQFRLEFKALRTAQRIALFERSFGLPADAATGAALERMDTLAPADFANVVRQLSLLELSPTVERATEMLATELRTRLAATSATNPMGFV